MRTAETDDLADSLPLETIRAVLREHSVQVAILFGSHATGTTHPESDLDIAVELQTVTRGDPSYNGDFFSLSADLSDTLETDAVDIVDIHTLSSNVAKTVFDQGILLLGEQAHAADLRRRVTGSTEDALSPRERFDNALAKIDEHLGTSAVTATDGNEHK